MKKNEVALIKWGIPELKVLPAGGTTAIGEVIKLRDDQKAGIGGAQYSGGKYNAHWQNFNMRITTAVTMAWNGLGIARCLHAAFSCSVELSLNMCIFPGNIIIHKSSSALEPRIFRCKFDVDYKQANCEQSLLPDRQKP